MRPTMLRILCSFLTLLLLALPVQADRLLVFAAASLAGPLDTVAKAYGAETGTEVVVSYAGSSALARQIEQGAPADVFLSANQGWMDHLAAMGHIDNATRADLWGNDLVLVASAPGPEVALTPETDLMALLSGGRLALAVPAGIYAREALTTLGLWDAVKESLAPADNVRSALALVATGAAPWGVVYATDARAEPAVHVRGTFPAESHPAITYPGAVIQGAGPEAHAFLSYLSAAPSREVFEAAGFRAALAP